jgi:F1F0 ATPase subunit 2
MINNLFLLLLASIGGGFLGVFYFAGLRWTLRKSIDSRSAALWFSLSFLLRSGVCIFGIYWLGANDVLRILACLGGFIVARMIVLKMTDDLAFVRDPEANEAGRAS